MKKKTTSKKVSKIKNKINTEDFDEKFEHEDISDDLDWEHAVKRVNVDFPLWMLSALDKEAAHLQVPRQAVIKVLLSQSLDSLVEKRKKIA